MITNCTSLNTFILSNNNLSGQLPQVDWTPLSHTLQIIYIHDNPYITGPIPPFIGNCTLLLNIDLSNSNLIGPIPESLAQLSVLKLFHVYHNSLSGAIPVFILTNCTELTDFQAAYNNLSGSLPAQIGQLSRMQTLTFQGNLYLQGSIPDNVGIACPQLTSLVLDNTSVGGYLPLSLFNLSRLQRLNLASANFEGSLSPLFGNLSSLQYLELGDNAFTGPFPSELGNLKSLGKLILSNNQLTGEIPPQLSSSTSLTIIDFSFNALLHGGIPLTFTQLKMLTEVRLDGCNLSGGIPDIFSQLKQLQTLNLANNHFTGTIPLSLANLATLSLSLDLSFNSLSGTIPASLGKMNMLNSMNLSSNNFTGPIPAALGGCQSLMTLDLSFNQLNGEIPNELDQLKSLQYLSLSHNQLSGSLPYSLGSLSELILFDVSYNNLQGPIPDVGIYRNQSEIKLLGNPALCGFPTHSICTLNNKSSHAKRRTMIIAGSLACILAIVSLLLILMGLYCWRTKQVCASSICYRAPTDNYLNGSDCDLYDFESTKIKPWKAMDLRLITNGFHSSNVIGSGGMSVCYKGRISDLPPNHINRMGYLAKHEVVAIKRLSTEVSVSPADVESQKSFLNELKTICKMRHRNLVKVLGYCVEGGEVALVMEFMEKGDLHGHLHPTSIDQIQDLHKRWEERLNVALDVAQGLVYMHHEYEQPIIHCDIKPKNILLGLDMVAKISDFGIAKLIDGHRAPEDVSASKFRGTYGYAAPEYAGGLRISTQADIYSYGILLIEIMTGRSPTSFDMEEHGASNLHTWALLNLQNGRTLTILDNAVREAASQEARVLRQAKAILMIGVKCSCPAPKDRPPSMKAVRDALAAVLAGKEI